MASEVRVHVRTHSKGTMVAVLGRVWGGVDILVCSQHGISSLISLVMLGPCLGLTVWGPGFGLCSCRLGVQGSGTLHSRV